MAAPSATVPQRLGRYEVLGRIASGGMAEILLGRIVGPSGFERPVVVKRILSHLASSPSFKRMFLAEARIVASIRHPNVVHVYELGSDADELYLAMEYLEGESVSGIMRRLWSNKRSMTPEAAALIAAGACAGLHAAHELCDAGGRPLDLVHRDVSPQNIFVTYQGEVKLLDFGIAKVGGAEDRTTTGLVKGKNAYMSPEQCLAKPLDRRSDIFSLGVVLFEMATTRRLFARENPLLVFRAICEDPIPSIASLGEGPVELDRIAARALARRPADRYATTQEMRRELLGLARDLTEREPEEVLAEMMRDLFPERIAEKSELRHKVEHATAMLRIPEPETDVGITIPVVEALATEEKTRETRIEGAHRKRTSARLFGVLGVGTLAIAALGLGVHFRGHDTAAGALSSATTGDATAIAAAPSASVPPTSATVVAIDIQTKPDGARVVVAGEDRGRSPLRLELIASTDVVPVELTLDGYAPQRIEVRPDVEQRLLLTLDRASATSPRHPPASSPPRPAPSAPASQKDGFRRFD